MTDFERGAVRSEVSGRGEPPPGVQRTLVGGERSGESGGDWNVAQSALLGGEGSDCALWECCQGAFGVLPIATQEQLTIAGGALLAAPSMIFASLASSFSEVGKRRRVGVGARGKCGGLQERLARRRSFARRATVPAPGPRPSCGSPRNSALRMILLEVEFSSPIITSVLSEPSENPLVTVPSSASGTAPYFAEDMMGGGGRGGGDSMIRSSQTILGLRFRARGWGGRSRIRDDDLDLDWHTLRNTPSSRRAVEAGGGGQGAEP